MTIITLDNGEIVYCMPDYIKSISPLEKKKVKPGKEVKEKTVRKQDKPNDKTEKTKGYFGTVGVNAAFGSFVGRFTTVHGYFYKGFSIGVGVGLGYASYDYYSRIYYSGKDVSKLFENKGSSLPVFLHISQELSNTKVTPYIEANGGLDIMDSFPIAQVMAGLGIKGRKSSFRLGGGYDFWYGPIVSLYFKF